MVLIPKIIKHIFEKGGGNKGKSRLEQIGHRWEMQRGFHDALPQMLLQLLVFKKLVLFP